MEEAASVSEIGEGESEEEARKVVEGRDLAEERAVAATALLNMDDVRIRLSQRTKMTDSQSRIGNLVFEYQ